MTDQFGEFGSVLRGAAVRRNSKRRHQKATVGIFAATIAVGTSGAVAAGVPVLDPLGISWVQSEQQSPLPQSSAKPVTLQAGTDWSASVHETPEGSWQFDVIDATGQATGTGFQPIATAAEFATPDHPRVDLIAAMPIGTDKVVVTGVASPEVRQIEIPSRDARRKLDLAGPTITAKLDPRLAPDIAQYRDAGSPEIADSLTVRPFAVELPNPTDRNIDVGYFDVAGGHGSPPTIVARQR